MINDNDLVAVAVKEIRKGEKLDIDNSVIAQDNIPMGHKIALKEIQKGEEIYKYGYSIGQASENISQGGWVHTHNVKFSEGKDNYEFKPNLNSISPIVTEEMYFNGYSREDGQAGIRNHVFVISTVCCANGPTNKIAEMANLKYGNKENFDGFLPITHPYGCSQTGKDLEYTQKILAQLAKNPNAGGVLIVSLGCEVNSIEAFKPFLGNFDTNRIKFLTLQEYEDEIKEGLKVCDDLYKLVTEYMREKLPISKLVIGVNCGGSDGLSGITANSILGEISNIVTSQGGSIIMTEVPEMFGAEKILMNRAKDKKIFNKIVDLINDYKAYFERYGEKASDNPTQGNKAGGLTTLADKSLGCVQKSGNAIVTDVLQYGERIKESGLNLLSGPGNDLIGVTGQIAAGSNLIIFTTGRGTPCGFGITTLRVSSNTKLYNKKRHWIDFNAGSLIEGESREKLTKDLLYLILKVASGEVKTNNETNNYYEIGILRDGVTL
jgi:altronate hydrolase